MSRIKNYCGSCQEQFDESEHRLKRYMMYGNFCKDCTAEATRRANEKNLTEEELNKLWNSNVLNK